MDGFEDKTDNCVYLMHTMETDEIRHSQWLERSHDRKKIWCIIAAILGLGVVDYEMEVFICLRPSEKYVTTKLGTSDTSPRCHHLSPI